MNVHDNARGALAALQAAIDFKATVTLDETQAEALRALIFELAIRDACRTGGVAAAGAEIINGQIRVSVRKA